MQGHNLPGEPTPHLAPALTAVVLCVVGLAVLGCYGRSLERRSIAALAADEAVIDPYGALYRIKNQGTALQVVAFETDSLLPLYGSSELDLIERYNRPFHVTSLFRDRPTGFRVFPVGRAATSCLIMQQKLAAIGPALRGRKVAVSVTPHFFFENQMAWAGGYAGNFSDLHAGELAFSTRLSLGLKQDAARRMLQYPDTLANRPLLRFALENLADGSPLGLACYDAVLPLGLLHNAILRSQDHWNVVCYLWRHPARKPPSIPTRGGRPLDWPEWHRRAEATYRPLSDNNAFGLDNKRWRRKLREETLRQRNTWSDEDFLVALQQHQEWADLELLLRVLGECGSRPLLLSMPIHGGWYDQRGVSSSARRVYYQKLREIAERHRATVVDFADHDADRSFCFDYKGHLGPRGWVHYGQVLDGFYHDAVPPLCELPAPRARPPSATATREPLPDRR